MKFKLYKNSEIFIICPANIDTGGPMCLHQLAYKLKKKFKKKVGISLKPKSKVDLIKDYLRQIDLVLVMSVEPGFAGQKFMPEVLPKLKELKEIINKENLNLDLEIDGGINFENSKVAKEAGANVLVSGSTIFKKNNGDLKKNIDLLRQN